MLFHKIKRSKGVILFLFYSLLLNKLFAQITITQPFERMVFQRNNQNQANIIISGNYYTQLDSVQARVVPKNVGWGTTSNWVTITKTFTNGYFTGNLTALGGWYQLEVRAYFNGIIATSKTVSHVGIGEVFVIAGQSNAQGGAISGYGATDDRVNSVKFSNDFSDYNKLPIGFSQLGDGSNIGPFHYVPWAWGKLGDLLTQRLNVPVLFYGAGHGGTSSTMWGNSALGLSFSAPNWVRQDLGAPYRALQNSVAFYASITGMRAVLWHQGESDGDTYYLNYYNNIVNVISKSRQNSEHSALAWVVARASINPSYHQNVIDGQNLLISQYPNVFAGPVTDNYTGSTYRTDGIHFNTYVGQVTFASAWDASLNNTFFSNSTPMMASALLPVMLSCNISNSTNPITLTAPTGYAQYAWSNRQNTAIEAQGISNDCCYSYTYYPPAGYEAMNWKLDSTNTITKPAARFAVNARKTSRKTFFSPIIDLTTFALPTTPSISASATQVRPNDAVTLTGGNCNGYYLWSNNATSNPLILNPSLTTAYTVRCKTLHCMSLASSSQTITVSTCFPNSLALTGNVIITEPSYESKQAIQSLQKIDISGKINYNAKTKVELLPGFESKKGSVFKAYILGCN